MPGPLFSVVIPTRERHDTLLHSIKTVLEQDFPDFELVVMDNHSSPATREVCDSFADPRLKYHRAPGRLSMLENWELALSKTAGQFITYLGDDDGLMPGALSTIAGFFQRRACEIFSWKRDTYWWPNAIDPLKRGLLMTSSFQGRLAMKNSRNEFERMFSLDIYFDALPMVYNSFVSRRIIEKATLVHGQYFLSSVPDVFSGLVNCLHCDRYLYSERSYSLAGISGHSNGASFHNPNLTNEKGQTPFEQYVREASTAEQRSMPMKSSARSEILAVAKVMEEVRERFLPANSPIKVNYSRLIALMLEELKGSPDLYDERLTEIRQLARLNQVPLNESSIPGPCQPSAPLRGLNRWQGRLYLTLECSHAGVANIHQAVWLLSGMLDTAEPVVDKGPTVWARLFSGLRKSVGRLKDRVQVRTRLKRLLRLV